MLWKVGLRANPVFRVRSDPLIVATFVEPYRGVSRIVWPVVVPIHLVARRYLLSRAVRFTPDTTR
ncbi:hypothetical protein [Saccharopolyspora sp. NPDC002376]